MSSFGDQIAKLLDLYADCLTLLKKLGRNGSVERDHHEVARSLRSERSSLKITYLNKLDEEGSSLERGDSPARRVLRRINAKLQAAITSASTLLLRRPRQSVDLVSLRSLTSTSGRDAKRTIESLSVRLESRSSEPRALDRGTSPRLRRETAHSAHPGSRRRPQPSSAGLNRTAVPADPVSRASSAPTRDSRESSSSGSTKLGEVRHPRSSRSQPEVAYPIHRRTQDHESFGRRRRKW